MPFQRRLFCPSETQNLLAGCIFDRLACQKCFCVTFAESNKGSPQAVEWKGSDFIQRTISAMVGKGSVNHNSRKFKAENVNADRSHLNIDYCNENIKKVYHELFDEALEGTTTSKQEQIAALMIIMRRYGTQSRKSHSTN